MRTREIESDTENVENPDNKRSAEDLGFICCLKYLFGPVWTLAASYLAD